MEILLIILGVGFLLLIPAWLLPERWQMAPLIIATAVLLAFYSPTSLLILASTSLLNFYLLRYIPSLTTATLVVVIQLSCIFLFFKMDYAAVFGLGESGILPLGLSYYSFRQIHYALEAYKKTSLKKHSLWEYMSYLFFLPTILIGPINRFQAFQRDLKRRRWDNSLFSQGLERILYGFVKIVVLGNYLFSYKLNNFALGLEDSQLWLATYLKMFRFAANAYVQFAGFSDVAIGLSLLFGFKVMENFNSPFKATNIADFWNRWHISLSEWCRDYVFYPFLGMTRNARISIIMSMLVLAGWHEISLRYLLWGIMHALAINLWHRYNGSSMQVAIARIPLLQKSLGIGITLHFVMLSFILTNEVDMLASWETYKILFFLN